MPPEKRRRRVSKAIRISDAAISREPTYEWQRKGAGNRSRYLECVPMAATVSGVTGLELRFKFEVESYQWPCAAYFCFATICY